MSDTAGLPPLDDLLAPYLRRDVTPLLAVQSVGEALARLRSKPLGERIVYFYVVDEHERLVGVVPTRRLLTAELGTPVGGIMAREVVRLPAAATLRDAVQMFLRHRLLALPMVDADGHILGVADVSIIAGELSDAERQRANDVFQLIGARVAQPAAGWRGFHDRFPWLLCNIGGGLVAALIAAGFESLLDRVIALALFIPVVLAVSESVAMQSVTLTLQTLHGVRADGRFVLAALRRELTVASLLGAGCGSIIGAVVWAWKGTLLVAVSIFLTVAVAMPAAALLGVALPAALRVARRDPRIAAGPIVLALTDFLALIVYFSIARWLLS